VLAESRGFCAGVNVAINTVIELAEKFPGEPLYMVHEIVHNKHVVADLSKRYNIINIEDISQVPDGSRIVLSAHGSPPGVYEEARKRNLKINDATCDLVRVVHNFVRKYSQRGFEMVLIGHTGHQEVIGTMGQADGIHLVENVSDVNNLPINLESNVAYVTQTTLSRDETRAVEVALRERFPNLLSSKDNLCYATTDNQEAVKTMIDQHGVQRLFVVGEQNSSNSKSLVATAIREGISANLISTFENIEPPMLAGVRTAGVTSGASVPDYLVDEVLTHLTSNYGGKIITLPKTRRDINFKPKELV